MKKFVLLALLMSTGLCGSAQYVTIPDDNFADKLGWQFPECMVWNELDTTCSAIIEATVLDLSYSPDDVGYPISDLTGIEYFQNLEVLILSNNDLPTLPVLPQSLTELHCDAIGLVNIPEFPSSLLYLDCSENLFTDLPELPASLTYLDISDIGTDLEANEYELPDLPPILNYLDCSGNDFTVIPELPGTLTYLDCGDNNLNELPELPATLTYLNCNWINNSGDPTGFELPELPNALTELYCKSNGFDQLPTLPSSLTILECTGNDLTGLPELPGSLIYFNCQNNDLTELPELPNSLTELNCAVNDLSQLPDLPNSLLEFRCDNNDLTELPELPDSLLELICHSNDLTELPELPNSLNEIKCWTNFLSTLPELPSSLVSLNCEFNPLTSLPQLPESLEYLTCSNNELTSLPELPESLTHLKCDHNELTTLPVLPGSVQVLYCHNNNLTSLPELPESLTRFLCNNNELTCLPTLPMSLTFGSLNLGFNISNNPFTCLPNYVPAMEQQSIWLTYPLCELADLDNNPYGCNSINGIAGTVFNDDNENCELDEIEAGLVNAPINLLDEGDELLTTTYTFSNSIYNLQADTGIYTVQLVTENMPFEVSCDDPGDIQNAILSEAEPSALNIDFGVECPDGYDIGTQSIVPLGWVFPGQVHTLKVAAGDMSAWYGMQCAENLSGTVTIIIDGPVNYLEPADGALTPTVSGDLEFTYEIADFENVNFQQDFALLLYTETSSVGGEQVCVDVVVDPTTEDFNLTNNSFSHCYWVVNSYDPNIKQVWPQDVESGYDGYFNYTIYFQNTGNAPAFNIRVADTLDTDLDLGTFEVTAYSHECLTYVEGNVATFRFNDIMLPDSTSDFEGSIGYVQYRIKPVDDLPVGTVIENTAHIYFDFNEAIVTNTTQNEFVITTSVADRITQSVQVFPNPGTGQFNVLFRGMKNGLTTHLEVYNLSGQRVLQRQVNENRITLDLTDYPSGMYLLHVRNERGSQAIKLLKQ